MNRTTEDTEGCGLLFSNHTLFADSLLSRVQTAEEAIEEVLYFLILLRQTTRVFLATLEYLMKACIGGFYLAMKSNPIVPCASPLMSIIGGNYQVITLFSPR